MTRIPNMMTECAWSTPIADCFLSNELQSREFPILRPLGVEMDGDKMRLGVFWDYGVGELARPDFGEPKNYSLMSLGLGLGLHYLAGPIYVNAEWGAPLLSPLPANRPIFHLSVGASF